MLIYWYWYWYWYFLAALFFVGDCRDDMYGREDPKPLPASKGPPPFGASSCCPCPPLPLGACPCGPPPACAFPPLCAHNTGVRGGPCGGPCGDPLSGV